MSLKDYEKQIKEVVEGIRNPSGTIIDMIIKSTNEEIEYGKLIDTYTCQLNKYMKTSNKHKALFQKSLLLDLSIDDLLNLNIKDLISNIDNDTINDIIENSTNIEKMSLLNKLKNCANHSMVYAELYNKLKIAIIIEYSNSKNKLKPYDVYEENDNYLLVNAIVSDIIDINMIKEELQRLRTNYEFNKPGLHLTDEVLSSFPSEQILEKLWTDSSVVIDNIDNFNRWINTSTTVSHDLFITITKFGYYSNTKKILDRRTSIIETVINNNVVDRNTIIKVLHNTVFPELIAHNDLKETIQNKHGLLQEYRKFKKWSFIKSIFKCKI